MVGFSFCQPFLIQGLQTFLLDPTPSKNTGYGFIGAAIFIYSGLAISTAIYEYNNQKISVQVRGCLVSSVFRQMTRLKANASTEKAASLTLMSSDVERIIQNVKFLHDYYANLVEGALAAWLLQRQLGLAFLVPIGVVLVCFCISLNMGKLSGPRQKVWMQATQQRVQSTASTIAGLKVIKMLGLATLTATIERLRATELSASKRFRHIAVLAAANGFAPTYLMPFLTFAATSRSLDLGSLFVSLSFMLLLANPLIRIFQLVPQSAAGFACLVRIQTFLELDARVDNRQFPATNDSSGNSSEGKGPGVQIIQEEHGMEQEHGPEQKLGGGRDIAIEIKEGCFGWVEDKLSLQDLSIRIPKSSLTIVVGPVGSGKSTLCSVLLGEVTYAKGYVIFAEPLSNIGSCGQTAFLPNVSIRDAVIGYSQLDTTWYDTVIKACALEIDLLQLSDGDKSIIGSNGAALSGGQRLRVALARAVYSRASIVVLDDILSGLDRSTGEEVFTNLLGNNGLLRLQKTTIVLCTHDLRFLAIADHLIVLDAQGQVARQGKPDQVLAKVDNHVPFLGDMKEEGLLVDDGPVPTSKPPQSSSKSPVRVPDAEERNRQLGDIAIYEYYFSMYGFWNLVSLVFMAVSVGFLANFSTIWLKWWSDSADASTPGRHHGRAYYLGIYAMLQTLTLFVMMSFVQQNICTMAIKTGAIMHSRLLSTLMRSTLYFITNTDTGETLNRFSQDLSVADGELSGALTNLAVISMTCIGQAAVIATASPYLAISYPFLLFLLYTIQKFYLRTSRQLRFLDLEMKSPL